MTKGKTIGLVLFGLLVAIVVAVAVWPREKAATFASVTAEKGVVTQSVDLTGAVAYQHTRRAAFMLSGEMATMRVEVGDIVAKGDVLATLQKVGDLEPQITAPIAGVVTEIAAWPGELVQAGMPVVVVQGPAQELEVMAYASENDVAELAVGDEATIAVGALDEAFAGRVQTIAPVAMDVNGVTTYAVVVSLESAIDDGKGAWEGMRAGMTADVTVVTAEARNAVYVPRKAVLTRGGEEYVRVVVGEEYEEREVKTGLRGEENRVVVLEGVAEGEEVVVKILE